MRSGSAESGFFEVGTVAEMVTILDHDLYPDGLQQGYIDDACIDLAIRYTSPWLAAHTTHRAQLGVSVRIPDGYVGLVVPRTSTATVGVQVSTPVIDSGYTGEIHTWLTSSVPFRYSRGDQLVGLLVIPCVAPGAAPRKKGFRNDGTLASSDLKGPPV